MTTAKEKSDQKPDQDEQAKPKQSRSSTTKSSNGGRAATASHARDTKKDTAEHKASTSTSSKRSSQSHSAGSGSGTSSKSTAESQSKGGAKEQDQSSTASSQPVSTSELSKLLQEQVSLAIQPVLQDFRQQLASTVQHEVDQAAEQPGSNGTGTGHTEDAESLAHPPSGDDQAGGSQSRSSQDQAGEDASQSKDTSSSDHDSSRQSALARTDSGESEDRKQRQDDQSDGLLDHGIVKETIRPGINHAVKLLENQAEHVLELAITAAISAALSSSTRETVERGAENGIRMALDKTSGLVGKSAAVREIRAQTETTLLAIVRETLDAMYSDEVRADAEKHVEGASHELLHGNVGGAVGHLKDLVESVLQEILGVLQHQWHRLLRLVLKVVLAALEDADDEEKPRRSRSKGTGSSKKASD